MSDTAPDGLPDLPGSSSDPGTGPAVVELFETLLDDGALEALLAGPDTDVAPPAVAAALAAHREHRAAWYGDLVGPLLVPAELAEPVSDTLTSADHALRIVLVAPDGPHEAARQQLRGARDLLAEDQRLEVVGVRLALPSGPPAEAAARLLDSLDFTAPAFVQLRPGAAAGEALTVLAEDGAESLALVVDTVGAHELALTLRQAVDLDLTFRLDATGLATVAKADGERRTHGRLNVLCAVRAALNGAEVPEVTRILAATDAAPLTSALRRMSEADAAVARAFLAGAGAADVAAAVAELVALGLVDEFTLDAG